LFGADLPPEEFAAGYRQRLDGYGIPRIRSVIERVAREHPGQVLLLRCYERDPADCHRGLLAEWWREQTGQVIREWEPTGRPPRQMSLLDSKENR
jgi:hypothetical protein